MITKDDLLHSLLNGPMGQELRDRAQQDIDDRRAALAAELAEFDAGCAKEAAAMNAEQKTIDTKVDAIRAQLTPLEKQSIDLAFRRSNHNTGWCERRDSLWSQLCKMPCESLKQFADELRQRMDASGELQRDWSTNGTTRGTNREEVAAYQRSLFEAKTQLEIAIRTGVAGKAADEFVKATRATFPKVRRGPSDMGAVPTF